MAQDPMFNITYGLYVVTANSEGRDNGCITNTLAQVTSQPNRVSLTVNKQNLTHDMIAESGTFTASIISQEAGFGLFERFGFRSGRDADKFAGFEDTERLDNGTLAVTAGTNSYICARVCQEIDLGSHTMFIADVTSTALINAARSADYSYYLQNIKPQPKEVGTNEAGQTIWRCVICGYEYVGEELPEGFICPLCKHPASDFEKVVSGKPAEAAVPAGVSESGKIIWRCAVCGYEYEGEELPEDFVCPLCGVDASNFERVGG
ncbi:MAG: flavin reductase [Ruminococcus sp.]|nr:flavin reductase [Ruminococcus sp.]